MTASLYRSPWFLALSSITRGAGWTAHEAARSYLRETGESTLSFAVLPLVFAAIPARLHQIIIGALLNLGLWAKTPEGYELRGAPAQDRSPVALVADQARRDKAAAKKRGQRLKKKATSTATGASVPPPPASGPVLVVPQGTSPGTEGGTALGTGGGQGEGTGDMSPGTRPSLSLCPSENSLTNPEEESEQPCARGGDVPADVPLAVPPPVPSDVPASVPAPASGLVEREASPLLSPSAAPPITPPRPKPAPSAAVLSVFEHWRSTLTPRGELIDKRRTAIEAALKRGMTPEDCRVAIDGCARSDWHKRSGNTDLTLILRTDKVDRFLAYGRHEADPPETLTGGPGGRSSGRAAPPQPLNPVGRMQRRWGADYETDNCDNYDEQGRWIGPDLSQSNPEAAE